MTELELRRLRCAARIVGGRLGKWRCEAAKSAVSSPPHHRYGQPFQHAWISNGTCYSQPVHPLALYHNFLCISVQKPPYLCRFASYFIYTFIGLKRYQHQLKMRSSSKRLPLSTRSITSPSIKPSMYASPRTWYLSSTRLITNGVLQP